MLQTLQTLPISSSGKKLIATISFNIGTQVISCLSCFFAWKSIESPNTFYAYLLGFITLLMPISPQITSFSIVSDIIRPKIDDKKQMIYSPIAQIILMFFNLILGRNNKFWAIIITMANSMVIGATFMKTTKILCNEYPNSVSYIICLSPLISHFVMGILILLFEKFNVGISVSFSIIGILAIGIYLLFAMAYNEVLSDVVESNLNVQINKGLNASNDINNSTNINTIESKLKFNDGVNEMKDKDFSLEEETKNENEEQKQPTQTIDEINKKNELVTPSEKINEQKNTNQQIIIAQPENISPIQTNQTNKNILVNNNRNEVTIPLINKKIRFKYIPNFDQDFTHNFLLIYMIMRSYQAYSSFYIGIDVSFLKFFTQIMVYLIACISIENFNVKTQNILFYFNVLICFLNFFLMCFQSFNFVNQFLYFYQYLTQSCPTLFLLFFLKKYDKNQMIQNSFIIGMTNIITLVEHTLLYLFFVKVLGSFTAMSIYSIVFNIIAFTMLRKDKEQSKTNANQFDQSDSHTLDNNKKESITLNINNEYIKKPLIEKQFKEIVEQENNRNTNETDSKEVYIPPVEEKKITEVKDENKDEDKIKVDDSNNIIKKENDEEKNGDIITNEDIEKTNKNSDIVELTEKIDD